MAIDYHPPKTYRGYVKAKDGKWGVQVPSRRSKHGFMVFCSQEAWDGGRGFAREWYPLPPECAPVRIRQWLGWILNEEGDL